MSHEPSRDARWAELDTAESGYLAASTARWRALERREAGLPNAGVGLAARGAASTTPPLMDEVTELFIAERAAWVRYRDALAAVEAAG